MFNSKQKSLYGSKTTTSVTSNSFLQNGMKKSAETRSGNDAIKYNSTGNAFVDQFGQVGSYKQPRTFEAISKDMATIWAISPLLTITFTLYIRMITRVIVFLGDFKTKSVQRGAGLKHEGIMRMIWLAIHHSDSFSKNLPLFIAVGSWKDIITMLQYDLVYHGWDHRELNWEIIGKVLFSGLENPATTNLVKKYLPQIKANSKCTTVESQADNTIAKWICYKLFNDSLTKEDNTKHYNKYRKLKVSGTAHIWQQLISRGQFLKINFDTIHGRALSLLVSSKFLANQKLENRYEEWIASKPIAKFTGYVYELASKITHNLKKYQIDTINAQYNQLLELAGKSNTGFIVVKDTSGSMDSPAIGTKMSSYHIAKSISIFLANMLHGFFHNHYIDFSSKAILRTVKGSNFYEYWCTEDRIQSANTNFVGVAELFAQIKGSGVPESDFPEGIICISDGEFDRTKMYDTTNIVEFREILLSSGLSQRFVDNFKFAFWDIRNTFYTYNKDVKFETYGPSKNVFYFSGFDPSVITFLTGTEGQAKPLPKNATELFEAAMDQEILNLVEV